jgi:hypothetical protein
MFSPARLALATCLSTLALACAAAGGTHNSTSPSGATNAASTAVPPAQDAGSAGIYLGTIGADDNVLVSLRAQPAAGISGSYHHARGWSQEVYELTGTLSRETQLILKSGGNATLRAQGGRFEGKLSADGSTFTGTWSGPGGRRLPVTLNRVATWHTQSVLADGGTRSCERPRFADARYERLNRELAEACDYFLADGAEGPGKLRLEIDSLGQYMAAAVAYAENRGRELPPEVIALDLSEAAGSQAADQAAAPSPRSTALATRP